MLFISLQTHFPLFSRGFGGLLFFSSVLQSKKQFRLIVSYRTVVFSLVSKHYIHSSAQETKKYVTIHYETVNGKPALISNPT